MKICSSLLTKRSILSGSSGVQREWSTFQKSRSNKTKKLMQQKNSFESLFHNLDYSLHSLLSRKLQVDQTKKEFAWNALAEKCSLVTLNCWKIDI